MGFFSALSATSKKPGDQGAKQRVRVMVNILKLLFVYVL